MKINIYATVTLDGFIADSNGKEDIFDEALWDAFVKISKKHKAILWGRKTYDMVCTWGSVYLKSLKDVKIYVLTNSQRPNKNNVCFINNVNQIKEPTLLVSGGQQTYNFALTSLQINKIIFNVTPSIVNNGLKFTTKTKELQKFNKFKTTEKTEHYVQVELSK